jgi:hypothetical protein
MLSALLVFIAIGLENLIADKFGLVAPESDMVIRDFAHS